MTDGGDGVTVPGRNSDEGFSARLRAALGGKSGTWLAKQIDASPSTVNDWLRGESEPVLSRLVLCAEVLGVSVEWLASGKETARHEAQEPSTASPAPSASIDKHLISRAIEGVRRTYERHKVRLPTVNEVEAAWEIYERVVAIAETEEERRGALRMALDQLDRDLLATPSGKASGKQSA